MVGQFHSFHADNPQTGKTFPIWQTLDPGFGTPRMCNFQPPARSTRIIDAPKFTSTMPLAMNPSGENQAAPGGRKPPARKRGCLISFAVAVIIVLLGANRIYRPRFEAASPSGIEFLAWQQVEKKDYKSNIANPSECSRIISAFKRGTWTMPHMCKARARFRIQYGNGTVDHVDFMPGHAGPEFCEIRMGLGHYQLPRKDLFQTLREAGVDTSKIPLD